MGPRSRQQARERTRDFLERAPFGEDVDVVEAVHLRPGTLKLQGLRWRAEAVVGCVEYVYEWRA